MTSHENIARAAFSSSVKKEKRKCNFLLIKRKEKTFFITIISSLPCRLFFFGAANSSTHMPAHSHSDMFFLQQTTATLTRCNNPTKCGRSLLPWQMLNFFYEENKKLLLEVSVRFYIFFLKFISGLFSLTPLRLLLSLLNVESFLVRFG